MLQTVKIYGSSDTTATPQLHQISQKGMPSTDEHDWIFDFVLQFLESDKFDAAVMDFVDEKCFVFENKEENKFEYTDIHKEFRDHIEALISSNLGELGITSETFFESCEKGRNDRDINKQVFERMIAMEDFETFKKLMTKRNMELQLETIRSYNTTRNALKGDFNYDDDDQEMQDALEASLLSGECERSELPIPDELRVLMESHSSNHDDKQGPIGEAEMQEILRRSLMEMEMLHRQAELEQADLEQAVSLSLALEEERLRIHVLEAKGSSESLGQIGAGDKHSDRKEYRRESASAKSDDKLNAGGSAKAAQSSSSSSYVHSATMSPRQERSNDAPSQQAGSRVTQSALVASDVAEEKSRFTHGIEDDDGESSRRRKAGPRPVVRGDGLVDFAAPKPLHGRHLGYGALGAIPAIGASNALEDKRREAAEEIRKGQEQLSEQRKQEDKLRIAVGQVDPTEAEKRRKHMAEQRDRLISIKKTERDRKVREEEERTGGLASDPLPAGVLKSKGQAQAAAQAEAKGGDAIAGNDEKKRSAMRLALARRMKLDLIEGEEQKLAQLQEDQFADLDRKLQQVERLRRDNKEREIVLAEQVLRQQENVARNIQESAHDLRGGRS